MSSSTNRPVVVGIDGSASSDAALRWAVGAARRRHTRLRLVHAVDWSRSAASSAADAPSIDLLRDLGWSVLTTAMADLEDGDVAVETHLGDGRPAPVLLDEGRHAQLLVLGSRGRSDLVGLLSGSTSLQVAMHATCPVVVVRADGRDRSTGRSAGRVVVGVDGTEVSEPAIRFGFEEAADQGVGLTALHAWDWPYPDDGASREGQWAAAQEAEEAVLAERLAGWSEKYPDVHVTRVTRRADPAWALVHESAGAALTVVGTRGSGGFSGLMLGSVSHAVLHHADGPVAVVRTSGDRS
jgi:nucleotide-binding universal stress UspA family protein